MNNNGNNDNDINTIMKIFRIMKMIMITMTTTTIIRRIIHTIQDELEQKIRVAYNYIFLLYCDSEKRVLPNGGYCLNEQDILNRWNAVWDGKVGLYAFPVAR